MSTSFTNANLIEAVRFVSTRAWGDVTLDFAGPRLRIVGTTKFGRAASAEVVGEGGDTKLRLRVGTDLPRALAAVQADSVTIAPSENALTITSKAGSSRMPVAVALDDPWPDRFDAVASQVIEVDACALQSAWEVAAASTRTHDATDPFCAVEILVRDGSMSVTGCDRSCVMRTHIKDVIHDKKAPVSIVLSGANNPTPDTDGVIRISHHGSYIVARGEVGSVMCPIMAFEYPKMMGDLLNTLAQRAAMGGQIVDFDSQSLSLALAAVAYTDQTAVVDFETLTVTGDGQSGRASVAFLGSTAPGVKFRLVPGKLRSALDGALVRFTQLGYIDGITPIIMLSEDKAHKCEAAIAPCALERA